jgi:hypothetical protein
MVTTYTHHSRIRQTPHLRCKFARNLASVKENSNMTSSTSSIAKATAKEGKGEMKNRQHLFLK